MEMRDGAYSTLIDIYRFLKSILNDIVPWQKPAVLVLCDKLRAHGRRYRVPL